MLRWRRSRHWRPRGRRRARRATTGDARPARASAPVWTFVQPGGKTKCAHGGKFGFWARLASLERLIVFFEGGARLLVPSHVRAREPWYDPNVAATDDPRRYGGILALEDERNPFRSWSMVFVPSCGGDVFIGSADHTYRDGGRRLLIHHRGWDNGRAALAWAFRHVPAPGRVLVTGSSAGSVGSAFHAAAVIDRYRDADVAQLGDSLALLNSTPLRLTQWRGLEHVPPWMRAAPDVQPGRFTMAAFLLRLTAHYPRVRFARFNFDRDAVQERYFADEPRVRARFPALLRKAEAQLRARAPNYRSFLACGSSHTIVGWWSYFALREGGWSLADWVNRFVSGAARPLGCLPALGASSEGRRAAWTP